MDTIDKKNSEAKDIEHADDAGPYDAESLPYLDPPGPSPLSQALKRLKSRALHAVETRDRLPRTFFWSLFHTEVDSIKRRKDKERLLRKLYLGGSDQN